MIYQITPLVLRIDPAGSGRFGAPRGARTHNGIDYICTPGLEVLSPVAGAVTKLGYCYKDDLAWRYVQVTDAQLRKHRLFYVEPTVALGDTVRHGTPVGRAQDISKRYPGQLMRPHVHYEVMLHGSYMDPETLDT